MAFVAVQVSLVMSESETPTQDSIPPFANPTVGLNDMTILQNGKCGITIEMDGYSMIY